MILALEVYKPVQQSSEFENSIMKFALVLGSCLVFWYFLVLVFFGGAGLVSLVFLLLYFLSQQCKVFST